MPYDGGVRRRRVYSVVDAREVVGRHRLLRVRAHFPRTVADVSAAGSGGPGDSGAGSGAAEWTGRWCCGGPEWAEHPEVAAAVGAGAEGGLGGAAGGAAGGSQFWMEFGDWAGVFDAVWVCQLFPASWTAPRSTYPEADPLVVEGRWNRENRERALCGGGPGQTSWWANPQFRLVLPGRTQVYLTLTQQDRRYRPRPNRLNGQAPFEKRLVAGGGPADSRGAKAGQGDGGGRGRAGGGDGWEYEHGIGMVVVRRSAVEASRAGMPLRRADMELVTSPFRRARDVGIYSVRPADDRCARHLGGGWGCGWLRAGDGADAGAGGQSGCAAMQRRR